MLNSVKLVFIIYITGWLSSDPRFVGFIPDFRELGASMYSYKASKGQVDQKSAKIGLKGEKIY